MTRYLIDTNVILRFITGEPEDQAQQAKKLIEKCESGVLSVRILPLVVAEVTFVLTGRFYEFKRTEIARELIQFIQTPSFEVESRDVLIAAILIFRDHKIDYIDAYLAAEAQASGCGIASFYRDFKKISGLDLFRLK